QDMFFMLQKEVADRLAAAPSTSSYGRLSVTVGYSCKVKKLFNIGPGAFKPPPKVDSSIISLTPYAEPPVDVKDKARFMQVVTTAFSQRRKTLRNSLKNFMDESLIVEAGIDPACRAETLGLEEFAALANIGQ
ncbi:MAG: rRNA adenine dimethyltransferase family protein, partial [Pseudomonadota bacterium]